ncbi:MAG: hypothetical protein IIC30_07030 [Chloroflexi bacterium]|nr:hypothetical protein [Chloroflexota bacterium]
MRNADVGPATASEPGFSPSARQGVEESCFAARRQSDDPDPHFVQFKETRLPPTCPECGGLLKPATISFGQNLREEDIQASEEAAAQTDLVVALGSSLSVYPAASVPLMAADRGIPYIIINRGPTEHDGNPLVSLRLEGDVAEIFPPAVDAAIL